MKTREQLTMDKQDEKMLDIMKTFGMKTNVCKACIYFLQKDEGTSCKIEQCMDIRQPEVSMAMKTLKAKRVVGCIYENTGGKGRPIQHYKCPDKEKLVNYIFDTAEQKVQHLQEQLETLKELKAYYS